MQFQMPVMLVGGLSFQPDSGSRINQLYVLNFDSSSDIHKGFVPAKMSCDQSAYDALPKDYSAYPMQATLTVINKTSGGKTVQHVLAIVKDVKKA